MRAWLLVIAVLATFQPIVQVASTEDISSSSSDTSTQTSTTNNNKLNQINNDEEETTTQQQQQQRTKPDPETQVQIEKNLLSLFGMKSRPRSIDRSKVIIPEAMKQLYADITGQELRTTNLPKPGLHTKSANTVRSFQHEGNCSHILFFFVFHSSIGIQSARVYRNSHPKSKLPSNGFIYLSSRVNLQIPNSIFFSLIH